MPTFDRGSIVRVPFPYIERPVLQYRPAFVISKGAVEEDGSLLWVLMITSAQNRRWEGDVSFGDRYRSVGLPAPSVVRTSKIATIEVGSAELLGSVTPSFLERVMAEVRQVLGR